jgi:hypothetical protein
MRITILAIRMEHKLLKLVLGCILQWALSFAGTMRSARIAVVSNILFMKNRAVSNLISQATTSRVVTCDALHIQYAKHLSSSGMHLSAFS